jgi:hypothetical protein
VRSDGEEYDYGIGRTDEQVSASPFSSVFKAIKSKSIGTLKVRIVSESRRLRP